MDLLGGYQAPAGYVPPFGIAPITPLSGGIDESAALQSMALSRRMVYPNGRIPAAGRQLGRSGLGDGDFRQPAFLLGGAGYAMLSRGDAAQYHLAFTRKNGHRHYDTLNMTLFGAEREMLSDIGYTHTGYHAWTLASVAHNLVVPDFRLQDFAHDQRRARGDLQILSAHTPVQVIMSMAAPLSAGWKLSALRHVLPRPGTAALLRGRFFPGRRGRTMIISARRTPTRGSVPSARRLFSRPGRADELIRQFACRGSRWRSLKHGAPGIMLRLSADNGVTACRAEMQRIRFAGTSPLDSTFPADHAGCSCSLAQPVHPRRGRATAAAPGLFRRH